MIHFYFSFPAVFWGDIALDEEDLKLFHIDKAHDWVKQSVEDMGHSTGKYRVPSTPAPEGRAGGSDMGRCPLHPCPGGKGGDSGMGRCGPHIIGIWPIGPEPTCQWKTRGTTSSPSQAGKVKFTCPSKKTSICLFIQRFNPELRDFNSTQVLRTLASRSSTSQMERIPGEAPTEGMWW